MGIGLSGFGPEPVSPTRLDACTANSALNSLALMLRPERQLSMASSALTGHTSCWHSEPLRQRLLACAGGAVPGISQRPTTCAGGAIESNADGGTTPGLPVDERARAARPAPHRARQWGPSPWRRHVRSPIRRGFHTPSPARPDPAGAKETPLSSLAY